MRKTLFIIFVIFIFTPANFLHAATPIKILLVPGHDNEAWGAQYGNLKEADMNLFLATKIYNILKRDKKFKVYITRNSKGYTKEFANYFSLHSDEISAFKENAKTRRQDNIINGNFIEKENVPHNAVSEDVAIRLYGINKWANENGIDAVVHIHFNDYPRPDKWIKGKYKGFVIYVPEEQMVNSKASISLAKSIFMQLNKKYLTSTYEKEKGGLIPDQMLIALGSNDTLIPSVRALLIEYGYIYRFGNSTMRHKAYTNMANLTITGLKNYFFKK